MKNRKKIKTAFWSTLALVAGAPLIFAAVLAVAGATAPLAARAQSTNITPLQFTPQILISEAAVNYTSIPVGSYNEGVMTSDLLAKYIQAFYNYGMAIVAILAAIVLMAGGLLWLTSAGNDTRISQAKELISGSIVGSIILLSSWIILNTVNPDLLNLRTIQIQYQKPITSLMCEWRCASGGGIVNDALQSTSQWQASSASTCQQSIGAMPRTACPMTQSYSCYCMNNINVTPAEAQSLVACINPDGSPLPDYTSCEVKTAPVPGADPLATIANQKTVYSGYCKSGSGVSKQTECIPCSTSGQTCDYYADGADYTCANQSGLCGRSNGGGSCSISSSSVLPATVLKWLSLHHMNCNSDNNPPGITGWMTGTVYIKCNCE